MEVKQKLARALNELLEPIRERRARFEAQPELVREALAAGSGYAKRVAEQTMSEVRAALKLNYLG